MPVSGVALGAVSAGIVFFWAGIKGYSIPNTVQNLISGKSPAGQKVTAPVPVAAEIAAAAAGASRSVTLGGTGTGTVSNPTALQAYAFSLFPSFGWGPEQQAPLKTLWTNESGWQPDAKNPGSTAYGVAQFLDTTWAPYGPKTSNGQLQVKYGLEYIHDRYGTPAEALAFWEAQAPNHWY